MTSAAASKRTESKLPKPPGSKHNIEAVREEYYDRIAKHSLRPLWTVMKNVVSREPMTRCAPVIWHFNDVKRLVMEAGGLITAEEAERRVLILENPAMPGESRAMKIEATDVAWETERLTSFINDPDSRFGALLFFYDDAPGRHIAMIGGPIVPTFVR